MKLASRAITALLFGASAPLVVRSFAPRSSLALSTSPSTLFPRSLRSWAAPQYGGVSLSRRFSSKSNDDKSEEENSSSSGHDVGPAVMELDPEEAKVQQAFTDHQAAAPKLSTAVEVRSLVQYNHGYAVISTNSQSHPGFPGGSVVGFVPDDRGLPVFCFSSMSTHTQDLQQDGRASVTIAAKEFKGAADGRVNLMGVVQAVHDETEAEALQSLYLQKHPNAFWVRFGDFTWFRMTEMVAVRFVGGFARAGMVTPEEYQAAEPDVISGFGSHVASHMNEDHAESTIAMIAQQIPGLDVTEALITAVDSLGMYVKVTRTPRAGNQPQQFKLRLPFPRQAKDRKDLKDLIVEMSQAASGKSQE